MVAAGNGGNRDQRDGQIAVVKLFLDKGASGRDPLKWLAIWISELAATIWMSGLAQAASAPQAAGQIRPSSRAFAPITAGSTSATAAIDPSRPSSPSSFISGDLLTEVHQVHPAARWPIPIREVPLFAGL